MLFHNKVAAYCSSPGIDQEKDILSKMIEENGDDESDMVCYRPIILNLYELISTIKMLCYQILTKMLCYQILTILMKLIIQTMAASKERKMERSNLVL